MKKVINSLALAIAITIAGTATAQNAHESSVKFNKNNENAVVADYEATAEVVEGALKNRLEKEGLGKMKTSKGFMVYSGVLWNSVSNEKIDVYFKVEGKKDRATLSVLISKGYDNFVTSGSDSRTIVNVKAFLNSFINDAKAYQLRLSIAAQEKVVKEVEKDMKGSAEDGEKLLRDKEKVEKQIAENKTEQGKKQTVVDAEKKKLEEPKAQL